MTAPPAPSARVTSLVVASRYMPVYIALIVLVIVAAIWVPATLDSVALSAIAPFGALLGITALGQMLVIMTGGIDLSVPGTVTLSAMIIVGVGDGSDDRLWLAIMTAIGVAALIGLVNGILIGGLKLNALIVTLAMGQIVAGIVRRYITTFPVQSSVPEALSDWTGTRILGVSPIFWMGAAITILLIVALRFTTVGRRFQVVGANPVAANVVGVRVTMNQILVYVVAAVLYAIAGIALAGLLRNPGVNIASEYLLGPIAAAVIGGCLSDRRPGQPAVHVRGRLLLDPAEPDDAGVGAGDVAPVRRVRSGDHRRDVGVGGSDREGRRARAAGPAKILRRGRARRRRFPRRRFRQRTARAGHSTVRGTDDRDRISQPGGRRDDWTPRPSEV